MKDPDEENESPDDLEGKPERDVKKPDLKNKHDPPAEQEEEDEDDDQNEKDSDKEEAAKDDDKPSKKEDDPTSKTVKSKIKEMEGPGPKKKVEK